MIKSGYSNKNESIINESSNSIDWTGWKDEKDGEVDTKIYRIKESNYFVAIYFPYEDYKCYEVLAGKDDINADPDFDEECKTLKKAKELADKLLEGKVSKVDWKGWKTYSEGTGRNKYFYHVLTINKKTNLNARILEPNSERDYYSADIFDDNGTITKKKYVSARDAKEFVDKWISKNKNKSR